jgi:hypothetical protein
MIGPATCGRVGGRSLRRGRVAKNEVGLKHFAYGQRSRSWRGFCPCQQTITRCSLAFAWALSVLVQRELGGVAAEKTAEPHCIYSRIPLTSPTERCKSCKHNDATKVPPSARHASGRGGIAVFAVGRAVAVADVARSAILTLYPWSNTRQRCRVFLFKPLVLRPGA